MIPLSAARSPRNAATSSVLPVPAPADALREALIESRQRWRDLVTMAADIVFETDAAGRFTFLAPDHVLGWSAETLLGSRRNCCSPTFRTG